MINVMKSVLRYSNQFRNDNVRNTIVKFWLSCSTIYIFYPTLTKKTTGTIFTISETVTSA